MFQPLGGYRVPINEKLSFPSGGYRVLALAHPSIKYINFFANFCYPPFSILYTAQQPLTTRMHTAGGCSTKPWGMV